MQPPLDLLTEARRREKTQTVVYRALAAEAELAGHADAAERLNGLHADEQHHLSRLTARILELGGAPEDLRPAPPEGLSLEGWEDRVRALEEEEVRFYRHALERDGLDPVTEALLEEILASEIHHRTDLGGKWMPA